MANRAESGDSSKRRLKTICVFGGSSLGTNREFMIAGNELGKVLAARNINVVYGGGIQGLRGCAAYAARIGGSKVLGVCFKESNDMNTSYPSVGREIRVSNLPHRMALMLHSADAFIALPGGLETLDGISSIGFWAKLNFHHKPLGLLNISGFYNGLLVFLDDAVIQGFIPPSVRHTITSSSTADQLIAQLHICGLEPYTFSKQIDYPPSSSSKEHEADTTLRL